MQLLRMSFDWRLATALAILFSLTVHSTNGQCAGVAAVARVDCWPDVRPPNRQSCIERGCCWAGSQNSKENPACFHQPNVEAYRLVKDAASESESRTFKKSWKYGAYPNELQQVSLSVQAHARGVLRVTIANADASGRWRVPLPLKRSEGGELGDGSDFKVSLPTRVGQSFFVRVRRRSDSRLLFDTISAGGPLIFADQLLQLSVASDTRVVYGLGERLGPFSLPMTKRRRITMWSRDAMPEVGINLYGVHNFLLGVTDGGSAFGVFLLNSNAQEVLLQPRLRKSATVTYRTIGGIFDFFIFSGPTPADVIRQYWELLGPPLMPPLWSLGFHLCRWGHKTLLQLQTVVQRNLEAGIPIDTIWSDIDYMESYKDWTYDSQRYKGLSQYVQGLREAGKRFIVIVDPGIPNQDGYPPYDLGVKLGVLIKSSNNATLLTGRVWPGDVSYPDFTHPRAIQWWMHSANTFLNDVPVDGLWIDMNEPSNFYNGDRVGCGNNSIDRPPFVPKVFDHPNLSAKTLCLSAWHFLGRHYDLHSLYGYYNAKVAWQLLRERSEGSSKTRQFVLTRSTFPGIQRFAFHWTGDVKSNWENLKYSIASILSFNLFGIVNTGADVCGFALHTTEELCIRWTQLGAFYPFMRNHNVREARDQDPSAFSREAMAIMRSSVQLRYYLLPYLYTQFYMASNESQLLARSLMHEFPNDYNTWLIDDQLLIGAAIMACPVTEPGVTKRQVYFPSEAVWYDAMAFLKPKVAKSGGVTVSAPLSHIPVYYRGGHVITQQLPGNDTSQQQRTSPFVLTAALDSRQRAEGMLYWDEGDQDLDVNAFILLKFSVKNGQLTSSVVKRRLNLKSQMRLLNVEVLGLRARPISVTVNDEKAEFEFDSRRLLVHAQCKVDLRQRVTVRWNSSRSQATGG